MLSRLLLFDSMDVIGPAATSHLPTALILFLGKLQGKLAERRQATALAALPVLFLSCRRRLLLRLLVAASSVLLMVTALDIPSN